MMIAYRAAYWVSADGQASIVLTLPEHSAMTDDTLLSEALGVIESASLVREDGDRIIVGECHA